MLKLFIFAIINSICNTFANSLWKYQFNRSPLNTNSFFNIIKAFLNINVILGIIFYFLSMLTFFYLLSNYNMSTVVPLLAMNYIFNLITAKIFFKEDISIIQIMGIIIIVLGIFIFAKGIKDI